MDDFWEASWVWFAGWTALRRAQRAVGRWSLFSSSRSNAAFFDFGAVLGGFGRPKWRPKSIFERFFSMFFSIVISASIFWRFCVIFLSPNLDFCAHSQCFVRIYTKSTFWKDGRKIIDFGLDFGGQNDEQSRKNRVERHAFFWLRFFSVFLRFLMILARFWEALGPPKLWKNRPRWPKSGFWDVSWTRLSSKVGLGRVSGGFWKDFGRILGGFWKDFGRILERILSNIKERCGTNSD